MLLPKLRKSCNVLFHGALVVLALLLAFVLKHDLAWLRAQAGLVAWLCLLAVVVKGVIFARAGLFGGWWKYVSLPDLEGLLKANLAGSGLLLSVVLVLEPLLGRVSPAVFVLDAMLCFLATTGVRVLARLGCEQRCQFRKLRSHAQKRVLVVGAGAIGQTIVREIRQCTRLNQRVIGFVDSDPERQGQRFQGLPVLGTQTQLEQICRERNINQVIVARSALCPRELREIVSSCQRAQVQVKTLPAVGEILNGEVTIQQLRDIQIEDLLGRAPVGPGNGEVAPLVAGKVVLVTGAGGSIGSEICRQVAEHRPARLVILDNGETPLFIIERELQQRWPGVPVTALLADVRDESRIASLFRRLAPEVVFHAAAYKHVLMAERNPAEVLRNNVFGTIHVARAAARSGTGVFVMISTDKAVNPTGVMGASKRFAERMVQGFARQSATRFITVRFGNVLGSNGSVVPIFREQIARGGPVTVTHPEVTRFFMTIPEAVNLVLHAGHMGRGGEIFLLDMGEPVKIVHLAEEMIRLSGFKPYEEVEIVFTGLKEGEKLYEELLLSGEGLMATGHGKIWMTPPQEAELEGLLREVEQLRLALADSDARGWLEVVGRVVPEFRRAAPDPVGLRPPRAVPASVASPVPPALATYRARSGLPTLRGAAPSA